MCAWNKKCVIIWPMNVYLPQPLSPPPPPPIPCCVNVGLWQFLLSFYHYLLFVFACPFSRLFGFLFCFAFLVILHAIKFASTVWQHEACTSMCVHQEVGRRERDNLLFRLCVLVLPRSLFIYSNIFISASKHSLIQWKRTPAWLSGEEVNFKLKWKFFFKKRYRFNAIPCGN